MHLRTRAVPLYGTALDVYIELLQVVIIRLQNRRFLHFRQLSW